MGTFANRAISPAAQRSSREGWRRARRFGSKASLVFAAAAACAVAPEPLQPGGGATKVWALGALPDPEPLGGVRAAMVTPGLGVDALSTGALRWRVGVAEDDPPWSGGVVARKIAVGCGLPGPTAIRLSIVRVGAEVGRETAVRADVGVSWGLAWVASIGIDYERADIAALRPASVTRVFGHSRVRVSDSAWVGFVLDGARVAGEPIGSPGVFAFASATPVGGVSLWAAAGFHARAGLSAGAGLVARFGGAVAAFADADGASGTLDLGVVVAWQNLEVSSSGVFHPVLGVRRRVSLVVQGAGGKGGRGGDRDDG